MTFSRHTSRIYLDDFDVQGAINVLERRIDEHSPCEATPYYEGAMFALSIISEREETRDQSVFMQVFDRLLRDIDVKPIEENGEN